MERIAVYFKLKPGKKDEYIRRHAEIWQEMSELLDAAGIRNYTIWNHDDMLFGYYEVKNRKRTDSILASSEVFNRWREDMNEFVWSDTTGQKEWFLENVFFHE